MYGRGRGLNYYRRGHSGQWANTVDKRGDVDGVYLVRDSPQVGDERYVKKKCLIQ